MPQSFTAYFYKKKRRWTWWNEMAFLLLSSLSGAVLGYLYLDIVFERQPLSFLRLIQFFYHIVLPMLPLIIFPKSVLRYLLAKNTKVASVENKKEPEIMGSTNITLKGQYAKDELSISKAQLLYVKSVDNYVMVYYLDGLTKNKMLRAKLSDMLEQAPFLIQPHRSYLINPNQAFSIKGNSQKATLTGPDFEEEIPIARSSYKSVKDLFN